MSSLLNVSNDASRNPKEFSLKDIEVVVDSEEQNWFKQVHIGKLLGLSQIEKSLVGLDKCEMLTRQELVPTHAGCSGPKEPAKQDRCFHIKKGVKYVISRSKKSMYNLRILAKVLGINIHENKWLFKEQETILNIMTAFKR